MNTPPTKTRRAPGVRLLLAACSLALLLPTTSFAQRGPTTAQVQEAEDRFREGRQFYGQGKFDEAYVKFQQACAVRTTMNCPKNLGLVENEMGRYADATTHLREFLKAARANPPADLTEEQIAYLQRLYDAAYARSGHLDVTAPAGARIVIDERTVGEAPLADPIDLRVGEQVVEVRTGARVMKQTVQVSQGKVTRVVFAEPIEPPRPEVKSDKPGSSSARTVTLVSLYAAALVGVGMGIGLTLHAQARDDEATEIRDRLPASPTQNQCNGARSADCDQLHSLRDTYDTDRTWATVGFVAGGVFAVAATTLFFVWPNTSRDESSGGKAVRTGQLVPLLAPGVGGLGYFGRF